MLVQEVFSPNFVFFSIFCIFLSAGHLHRVYKYAREMIATELNIQYYHRPNSFTHSTHTVHNTFIYQKGLQHQKGHATPCISPKVLLFVHPNIQSIWYNNLTNICNSTCMWKVDVSLFSFNVSSTHTKSPIPAWYNYMYKYMYTGSITPSSLPLA